MKSYTRNVDERGKVVVPAEIRAEFGNPKAIHFTLEEKQFILTVAVSRCKLCGSEIEVNDEGVGAVCIWKIKTR